ncbi:hypothetical protein EV363DRAFT_1416515 [Boletus edulis]|nr:hypothetical protein EV363DRAFT_1416515 [Boletus edulis]
MVVLNSIIEVESVPAMATFFASVSPRTDLYIDVRSPGITGPSWDVYRTHGPRPKNDGPFVELLEIDHKTKGGDIQVDEIESPAPPAYSYMEVVETKSEAPMARETLFPQSQDYIKQAMAGVGENPRLLGNVMVDICTKEIIDEIRRQASISDSWSIQRCSRKLQGRCLATAANLSAWPHVKGQPNDPILAYSLWEGSENDNFWIQQMERAMKGRVKDTRGTDLKLLELAKDHVERTEIGCFCDWIKVWRAAISTRGYERISGNAGNVVVVRGLCPQV